MEEPVQSNVRSCLCILVATGEDVNTAFNPFAKVKDKKKLKKIKEAKAQQAPAESNEKAKNTTSGETLGKGERYLIHDFNGVVKSGEMMLVVGRPGSGCTTFLKTLAGITSGYAGVDGEVLYGDVSSFLILSMQLLICQAQMTQKELKPYAKQVIFSSEEDTH